MTTGSAWPLCVGVGGNSGSGSGSGSVCDLWGMTPVGGERCSPRRANGLISSSSTSGSGSGLGTGLPEERRGLDANAPLSPAREELGNRRAGDPRGDSVGVGSGSNKLVLGRAGLLVKDGPDSWLCAADPSRASCVDWVAFSAAGFDGLRLRRRRMSGLVRERLDLVGDAKDGRLGLGIKLRGGGGSGGVVDSVVPSSRSLLRRGDVLRRFGADSSIVCTRQKTQCIMSTSKFCPEGVSLWEQWVLEAARRFRPSVMDGARLCTSDVPPMPSHRLPIRVGLPPKR